MCFVRLGGDAYVAVLPEMQKGVEEGRAGHGSMRCLSTTIRMPIAVKKAVLDVERHGSGPFVQYSHAS